jgi:hypothetical protein
VVIVLASIVLGSAARKFLLSYSRVVAIQACSARVHVSFAGSSIAPSVLRDHGTSHASSLS